MNKVALITGGSKRIGREISLFLARNEYDIVVHYNSSKGEAESLKKEILEIGVNCQIIQADLNKVEQVKDLSKKIRGEFKNWSLLVNNASIFSKSSLKDSEIDQLSDNFNIHLQAPIILSQELFKHCQENNLKGNVINMVDKNITRIDTMMRKIS